MKRKRLFDMETNDVYALCSVRTIYVRVKIFTQQQIFVFFFARKTHT